MTKHVKLCGSDTILGPAQLHAQFFSNSELKAAPQREDGNLLKPAGILTRGKSEGQCSIPYSHGASTCEWSRAASDPTPGIFLQQSRGNQELLYQDIWKNHVQNKAFEIQNYAETKLYLNIW